ncbi:acyl carrier protein [Streptomyces sp. MH60]|uniref:acyl carrier protein n=1 Tax=Streptomyces sp. MH60 TaxID=1940758 RepID=UPI000CEF2F54|nr:phosphopantetheine-binding protein [Streptomyces sp. MH60]PPS76233.1 Acyl carrier protein [Streptomyces sp. MH60]
MTTDTTPHSRAYALLASVLGNKFEVPPEAIVPTATFEQLDLDSLAVVELFVVLTEELGIEVQDAEADPDLTLAGVADLIAEAVKP